MAVGSKEALAAALGASALSFFYNKQAAQTSIKPEHCNH
jgi:hypothetical protein